jgi:hypothetical protein
MIINKSGIAIRLKVADIPLLARHSGVRLINLENATMKLLPFAK